MEENIELVDNKKFGISSKSVLTGGKIKAECYTVRGMDLVTFIDLVIYKGRCTPGCFC